jgi:hypothetical protein
MRKFIFVYTMVAVIISYSISYSACLFGLFSSPNTKDKKTEKVNKVQQECDEFMKTEEFKKYAAVKFDYVKQYPEYKTFVDQLKETYGPLYKETALKIEPELYIPFDKRLNHNERELFEDMLSQKKKYFSRKILFLNGTASEADYLTIRRYVFTRSLLYNQAQLAEPVYLSSLSYYVDQYDHVVNKVEEFDEYKMYPNPNSKDIYFIECSTSLASPPDQPLYSQFKIDSLTDPKTGKHLNKYAMKSVVDPDVVGFYIGTYSMKFYTGLEYMLRNALFDDDVFVPQEAKNKYRNYYPDIYKDYDPRSPQLYTFYFKYRSPRTQLYNTNPYDWDPSKCAAVYHDRKNKNIYFYDNAHSIYFSMLYPKPFRFWYDIKHDPTIKKLGMLDNEPIHIFNKDSMFLYVYDFETIRKYTNDWKYHDRLAYGYLREDINTPTVEDGLLTAGPLSDNINARELKALRAYMFIKNELAKLRLIKNLHPAPPVWDTKMGDYVVPEEPVNTNRKVIYPRLDELSDVNKYTINQAKAILESEVKKMLIYDYWSGIYQSLYYCREILKDYLKFYDDYMNTGSKTSFYKAQVCSRKYNLLEHYRSLYTVMASLPANEATKKHDLNAYKSNNVLSIATWVGSTGAGKFKHMCDWSFKTRYPYFEGEDRIGKLATPNGKYTYYNLYISSPKTLVYEYFRIMYGIPYKNIKEVEYIGNWVYNLKIRDPKGIAPPRRRTIKSPVYIITATADNADINIIRSAIRHHYLYEGRWLTWRIDAYYSPRRGTTTITNWRKAWHEVAYNELYTKDVVKGKEYKFVLIVDRMSDRFNASISGGNTVAEFISPLIPFGTPYEKIYESLVADPTIPESDFFYKTSLSQQDDFIDILKEIGNGSEFIYSVNGGELATRIPMAFSVISEKHKKGYFKEKLKFSQITNTGGLLNAGYISKPEDIQYIKNTYGSIGKAMEIALKGPYTIISKTTLKQKGLSYFEKQAGHKLFVVDVTGSMIEESAWIFVDIDSHKKEFNKLISTNYFNIGEVGDIPDINVELFNGQFPKELSRQEKALHESYKKYVDKYGVEVQQAMEADMAKYPDLSITLASYILHHDGAKVPAFLHRMRRVFMEKILYYLIFKRDSEFSKYYMNKYKDVKLPSFKGATLGDIWKYLDNQRMPSRIKDALQHNLYAVESFTPTHELEMPYFYCEIYRGDSIHKNKHHYFRPASQLVVDMIDLAQEGKLSYELPKELMTDKGLYRWFIKKYFPAFSGNPNLFRFYIKFINELTKGNPGFTQEYYEIFSYRLQYNSSTYFLHFGSDGLVHDTQRCAMLNMSIPAHIAFKYSDNQYVKQYSWVCQDIYEYTGQMYGLSQSSYSRFRALIRLYEGKPELVGDEQYMLPSSFYMENCTRAYFDTFGVATCNTDDYTYRDILTLDISEVYHPGLRDMKRGLVQPDINPSMMNHKNEYIRLWDLSFSPLFDEYLTSYIYTKLFSPFLKVVDFSEYPQYIPYYRRKYTKHNYDVRGISGCFTRVTMDPDEYSILSSVYLYFYSGLYKEPIDK